MLHVLFSDQMSMGTISLVLKFPSPLFPSLSHLAGTGSRLWTMLGSSDRFELLSAVARGRVFAESRMSCYALMI